MGWPSTPQALWCDHHYAAAIDAVELEKSEHRARCGLVPEIARIFEKRLAELRAARAALQDRGDHP